MFEIPRFHTPIFSWMKSHLTERLRSLPSRSRPKAPKGQEGAAGHLNCKLADRRLPRRTINAKRCSRLALRMKPSLPPASLPLSSSTTSYAFRDSFPTSARVPASVWLGYAVQLRSIREGDQACRVFWLTEPPLQAECKFDKAWKHPLLSRIRPLTPESLLCSVHCARPWSSIASRVSAV